MHKRGGNLTCALRSSFIYMSVVRFSAEYAQILVGTRAADRSNQLTDCQRGCPTPFVLRLWDDIDKSSTEQRDISKYGSFVNTAGHGQPISYVCPRNYKSLEIQVLSLSSLLSVRTLVFPNRVLPVTYSDSSSGPVCHTPGACNNLATSDNNLGSCASRPDSLPPPPHPSYTPGHAPQISEY